MDAGDIFNRGASIPRVINLTYEDTGLPIDTDDLDNITFVVFHYVTKRTLGTYSLSAGTVTVLDAVNGQVRFIIPQSVSATAKLGKYYINAITTETDTDYPDNTHIREGTAFGLKIDY